MKRLQVSGSKIYVVTCGRESQKTVQADEELRTTVLLFGIFNNIATHKAGGRIGYIDNIKSYMKGIEKKVKD
jgi:hypothetical protein